MDRAPAALPADVEARLADQRPRQRADLEDLVRIDSVSADPSRADRVGASAAAVAALLDELGLEVRTVTAPRPDGGAGAPAVIARRAAPDGAPTVLLYAHHDVQPPGTEQGWTTPAFEPTERGGRLYGRGAADDKAGVMVHVGALRAVLPAWGADDGVGVTVFVEGEEEVGSPSFTALLAQEADALAADVLVVADSDNWSVDRPSLTTSLRGLVDARVTVTTLDHAVHSGLNGGPVLDATTALVRLLDALRDEAGALVVPGLHVGPPPGVEVAAERVRADAGVLDGVDLIGTGTLAQQLWAGPSVTVVAMDVPPLERASNTLAPSATAVLSLRVAPGQDPDAAFAALREHLLATAPWGARVEVVMTASGRPFAADTTSGAHALARAALSAAWGGADVVEAGVGGSIPFIADLVTAMPGADVLVTGVEDPDTRAHGHDESLDLGVLERATQAEARLLLGLRAAVANPAGGAGVPAGA